MVHAGLPGIAIYAFVAGGNHDDNSDASDVILCGPEGFYAHTIRQAATTAETEAFVPEGIRHLVKVCERDEVDEIIGPFRDRRESLRLEAEERHLAAKRAREDGMTRSEEDPAHPSS